MAYSQTPAVSSTAPVTAAVPKGLAFDVATVKPVPLNQPPTQGWAGFRFGPDNVEAAWMTLPQLIQLAYGIQRLPMLSQITGVPDWAVAQRYDVVGKMGAADAEAFKKLDGETRQLWREAMLQTLLAERLHLQVHRGTKEAPVFELVVAKGGIKMVPAATDPNPPLGKHSDGTPITGMRYKKDTTLVSDSMSSLTGMLSSPSSGVQRPVIDKTGLTGNYDFTLNWSVYSAGVTVSNGVGGAPADDAPSIFTALGEIGLKLQPAMGTLETIAIDHVERPSEN